METGWGQVTDRPLLPISDSNIQSGMAISISHACADHQIYHETSASQKPLCPEKSAMGLPENAQFTLAATKNPTILAGPGVVVSKPKRYFVLDLHWHVLNGTLGQFFLSIC